MKQAKCNEQDDINFLIAAQRVYSSVEAAQTHPAGKNAAGHDAYIRLLGRLPPDSEGLWREVEGYVNKQIGILVIDDSTLDKPHARHMELVSRH